MLVKCWLQMLAQWDEALSILQRCRSRSLYSPQPYFRHVFQRNLAQHLRQQVAFLPTLCTMVNILYKHSALFCFEIYMQRALLYTWEQIRTEISLQYMHAMVHKNYWSQCDRTNNHAFSAIDTGNNSIFLYWKIFLLFSKFCQYSFLRSTVISNPV